MKAHVEEIRFEERCQARASLNQDAIAEYAERYREKQPLPPLDVYRVDDALVVVDGFHRLTAAIQSGIGFVPVTVVGEGSLDDASWYASGVNQQHGVRRSNDDKRKAVRLALDGIGQEQSNRVIADHCGVSESLVRRVRSEWEDAQVRFKRTSGEGGQVRFKRTSEAGEVTPSGAAQKTRVRKGRDGKSYPVRAEEPPSHPQPEFVTAVDMPSDTEALREVAAAFRAARLLAKKRLGDRVSLLQRIAAQSQKIEGALRYAEPVVCPKCEGVGCNPCDGRGWAQRGSVEL